MKRICFLLVAISVSTAVIGQELNVMSFNIRYNTSRDSLDAWPNRKDFVASQILFHEAHIVGLQEALYEQNQDLLKRLPQYKIEGAGRDDGREKGEFSAILYDTTRLQVLQSKTFWLSETPEVPGSKGWDAQITRIVTWIKFKDRLSKKTFFAFNTHFDHIGKQARKESAKFLLQQIKVIAGDIPAVITGDFNAKPSEEPIQVIMDKNNPLRMTDSKEISQTPHYGPKGTFNGFG